MFFFIGYFLYIYKELYVTGSCHRSKENEIIVYINLVKKKKVILIVGGEAGKWVT